MRAGEDDDHDDDDDVQGDDDNSETMDEVPQAEVIHGTAELSAAYLGLYDSERGWMLQSAEAHRDDDFCTSILRLPPSVAEGSEAAATGDLSAAVLAPFREGGSARVIKN